jgi:hypothetical protein
MNRRQMVVSLAGMTCAAVSGIAVGAAREQAMTGHNAAYEPWYTWPRGSGLILASSAAVLAASPHNSQPWQFRLGENQMELFADPRRTIGTIDPLLREQQIGTGCALENLIVAAERTGLGIAELLLDPEPNTNRIATIKFLPCPVRASYLYDAIPHRHTNRGPYLPNRPIPGTLLNQMQRLNLEAETVRLVIWVDAASKQKIRELIVSASEALVADREQSRDSAQWYRSNGADINRYRDGVTLDAQGLSPFVSAVSKLLPAPSERFADHLFLKRTKDVHCGPGATFATIAGRAPLSKETRVRIGRLWQRIHLWGTANGLAMQPLNQVHERIDREATTHIAPVFTGELSGLVAQPGWDGAFSFRMGYAQQRAKPSPRRDLADFLL